MVAGVELQKHATGYEMLNQQSEKQRFSRTQHKIWLQSENLVATYNFAASLFCTTQSLSGPILNPALKLQFLRSVSV